MKALAPRICYVLKRFPQLSQTFILNEVLELERQGLDVDIVSLRPPTTEPDPSLLKTLRASVIYLTDLQGTDILAAQAQALANLLRARRISAMHAHFASSAATVAMNASRISGVPFSFTCHARDIFHNSVDKTALIEKIAQARFVITVSDFNLRYLHDLMAEAGRSGVIHRLYNGMDLEKFTPGQAAVEENLVLSVGRLVPKKGFIDLIHACKALHDQGKPIRCVIIGEGEQRGVLEHTIASLAMGEVLSLAGARSPSQVIEFINKSSVFTLPCRVAEDGDRDGLPTVLLEAMACGVPTVSTAVTGIPEIIEHGRSGYLVPEKDPATLANAIAALLESPALRQSFAQAGLAKLRRDFDLSQNVSRLKAWLTEHCAVPTEAACYA
jgi:glycosyltransferase involved in cell wall biosynthesis